MTIKQIQYLLFDWGDTLMFDDPKYTGPMAAWESVSAMPEVKETIPLLYDQYQCIVVSNAGDSDSALMKKAFERIALDKYFTAFFTSKELRANKPSPAFFSGIINRLGAPPSEMIMIGNDYTKDIIGAKNTGMQTILITRENGDFPFADHIVASFGRLLKITEREGTMS